jgi:hypothetical protein
MYKSAVKEVITTEVSNENVVGLAGVPETVAFQTTVRAEPSNIENATLAERDSNPDLG